MKKYETPNVEILDVKDKEIITDSVPFENDSPLKPVEGNW